MFRLLYRIYNTIVWDITGENPYQIQREQRINMTKSMAAAFKKLFMSSASSAVGTGTVLEIHSATAPEEARIQDSNLYNPQIDDSSAIIKFNMDGANGYFAIAMFFLVFLMVLTAISLCC